MTLYLLAFWQILRFHHYLRQRNFVALREKVREFPVSAACSSPPRAEHLCRVVDIVCMWYPTQVLCLQRAAATVCILRQYGISAQMVIGVQNLPFKAHAWVEVDGQIVNDKPYTRDIYGVLDCC